MYMSENVNAKYEFKFSKDYHKCNQTHTRSQTQTLRTIESTSLHTEV